MNQFNRLDRITFRHAAILLFAFLVLPGCIVGKGKIAIRLKDSKISTDKNLEDLKVTVSNIQVVNHQIIITGTNLNSVSEFKIKDGVSNTTLEIESQTTTSIVANTLSNVTFAAGKILDFIFSNASAAATFTVNFSLCDSTLGGKGFSCTITPNDKEVLSYDAVSGKWKPRAISGLSYQGALDASGAAPSSAGPAAAGDYYIISVAGNGYSVGDWAVDNGTTMDRINNSTAITNVFGRTGAVTATEGDYNLDKLLDVNLTVAPTNGQVLKYNGTTWVAGSIVAVETDPSVTAFAKAALPTCGPGTVLKSDGTSLSCVTDSTGAGAFTGAINRAVMTDGAGALSVSSVTSTELGYLAGVTSAIQTQLDGKLAGSSFVDWSVAGVQTLEPTRLNLTTANRVVMTNGSSTPVASTVTNTELGYLSGVTSSIQTQLNSKAGAYTGTTNRVVLTDGATGALTTSGVTNTEVGYLSGVTSSIQTQIDNIVNGVSGAWTVSSGDAYRASGNVGVGTSSPATTLDVNGAISQRGMAAPAVSVAGQGRLYFDSTANKFRVSENGGSYSDLLGTASFVAASAGSASNPSISFSADPDTGWWRPATNTLAASTNGAERLRIDSNGNLLIGTTSNSGGNKINVVGSGAMIQHLIQNTNSAGSTNFALQANGAIGGFVGVNGTTHTPTVVWDSASTMYVQSSGMTGGLNLVTDNATQIGFYTNNTARMKIDSTGNVGIGTASPSTKLTVAGNMDVTGALGIGTTTIGANDLAIIKSKGSGSYVQSMAQNTSSSGGSAWAVQNDGIAGGWLEALGTTYSGGYASEVANTIHLGASNANLSIATTHANPIQLWTNNAERMRILSGGNVGIANTSPTTLLHIGSASVGTGVAVANFQNADGTCTVTPASSGSGIACSSDERLKENFQNVSGAFALDRVSELQAVTYNFKTSSDQNRRTGYKAQAVQKIAPEFVRQNEDGFLQVYYDAFIPWITEAIKELYGRFKGIEGDQANQYRRIASVEAKKADKAEVEQMRNELTAKDVKIKELEERLKKIENMINKK